MPPTNPPPAKELVTPAAVAVGDEVWVGDVNGVHGKVVEVRGDDIKVEDMEAAFDVPFTFDPERCNHMGKAAIDCPHCLRHERDNWKDSAERHHADAKGLMRYRDQLERKLEDAKSVVVKLSNENAALIAERDALRAQLDVPDGEEVYVPGSYAAMMDNVRHYMPGGHAETARNVVGYHIRQRKRAERERDALRAAVIECAVPLEVLHANPGNLSPALIGGIANAVTHVRRSLWTERGRQ